MSDINWSKVSMSSKFKLNGYDAVCITIKLAPEDHGGFQAQICSVAWMNYYMNKAEWPGNEVPYNKSSTGNIYVKYLENVEIVEY